MDNKKEKIFLALIILLPLTYIVFGIIFPANNNNYIQTTEKSRNINEDPGFNESNQIALERIRNSTQYINYNGSDIQLTKTEHIANCDTCWTLTYRYDVSPEKAPTGVKSIEMTYEIIGEKINHTTMTEITR